MPLIVGLLSGLHWLRLCWHQYNALWQVERRKLVVDLQLGFSSTLWA